MVQDGAQAQGPGAAGLGQARLGPELLVQQVVHPQVGLEPGEGAPAGVGEPGQAQVPGRLGGQAPQAVVGVGGVGAVALAPPLARQAQAQAGGMGPGERVAAQARRPVGCRTAYNPLQPPSGISRRVELGFRFSIDFAVSALAIVTPAVLWVTKSAVQLCYPVSTTLPDNGRYCKCFRG